MPGRENNLFKWPVQLTKVLFSAIVTPFCVVRMYESIVCVCAHLHDAVASVPT